MTGNTFEDGSGDSVALSPQQKQRLTRADAAGRTLLVLRLPKDVDARILRHVMQQVCERYDVFGLTFGKVAGFKGLRQWCDTARVDRIASCVDWSDATVTADAANTPVEAWLKKEAGADGVAANAPERQSLLRARVFASTEDGHDARHWHLGLSASALVLDAPSIAALGAQCMTAYAAAQGAGASTTAGGGRDEVDDESALPYLAFVEWQDDEANHADDVERVAALAYWSRHTTSGSGPDNAGAEVDVPIRLPFRLPAVAADADADVGPEVNRVLQHRVDPDVLADVVAWSKTNAIDVEDVLHAAWCALVARIAGVGDAPLCMGWMHDARLELEPLSGALGVFEQVLPLRLGVDRSKAFATFARELGETRKAHRQWAAWAAADAAKPVYREVAFGYRDDIAFFSSLSEKIVLLGETRTNTSLGLRAWHTAENGAASRPAALQLLLEVDPRQYSEASGLALLDQYATLLMALPEHGHGAIDTLPLLSDKARARLLAWRGEDIAFDAQTVLDRIAQWSHERADAPALRAADCTLDYRGLLSAARRMSARLAQHGVTADDRVALLLPRSGALVVALLGVMSAGAAYVPLDPSWPTQRLGVILGDAAPTVVLCATQAQCDVVRSIAGSARCVVWDDSVLATSQTDSVTHTAQTAAMDRPAYVIYTSGSTGTPKGVVIAHRQLTNYAAAVSRALDLTACRRYALTSTVAADLGNTTLFGALYNGACLVVAGDDATRSAASFATFLQAERIDCLKIVPSHLEALLDGDQPIRLPDVVVMGGETASPRLLARLQEMSGTSRLFNHYGPTEATIGVLVHRIAHRADAFGVPLTQPLANCHAYLLDARQRLVPMGAVGDLYIGGAQLATGYLDQRNADAFCADPFVAGERLYRTGDRGVYLPDGGVRLVGRADDQVKIRGHRVEPGEVAFACLSIPGIRQAAVLARQDATGAPELVAYVVGDATVTDEVVQKTLATMLPDAMVPRRFVTLDHMPRLANGKVDRQALPQPALESPPQTLRAPENAVETLLVGIVQALLPGKAISTDANFFSMGGDSLLVIRFVSRIQEKLDVTVLPGIVFTHPTVHSLANALIGQATVPEILEKKAQLRLRLDAMTPEARTALLQQAEAYRRAQTPQSNATEG